jgi:hypothetical protein
MLVVYRSHLLSNGYTVAKTLERALCVRESTHFSLREDVSTYPFFEGRIIPCLGTLTLKLSDSVSGSTEMEGEPPSRHGAKMASMPLSALICLTLPLFAKASS